MDSPQMYDTQHGQASGVLGGGDMKKPSGAAAQAAAAQANNNNNLTTLNNNNGTTKQTAALLKQHHLAQQYQQQQHGTELSDLNTPEISLDLQNLIDDSQFNEGLFSDILQGPGGKQLAGLHGGRLPAHAPAPQRYPSTTLAYMPQPVHSGATASNASAYTAANTDSNSSMESDVPSIKEEPVDPQDYRRQCPNGTTTNNGAPYQYTPTFTTLAPGGMLHGHGHGHGHGLPSALAGGMGGLKRPLHHPQHHSPGGRKSMKPADKTSDEYRRRRERNNIAVRKSREKAKVRTRETEEKVKLLVKENERLQKRIELLTEELNVLRSLFSNVGVLPEHLHREINKHLDSFQLQHQQQQQHMAEDRRVMDILQEYGP